jgi:peptide/nickel transport system permease protein
VLRFAAERLVRMVVVVWAMSLITFALFWAIPSYDAAYTLAGGPTGANTPEVRAQIRHELGLDKRRRSCPTISDRSYFPILPDGRP